MSLNSNLPPQPSKPTPYAPPPSGSNPATQTSRPMPYAPPPAAPYAPPAGPPPQAPPAYGGYPPPSPPQHHPSAYPPPPGSGYPPPPVQGFPPPPMPQQHPGYGMGYPPPPPPGAPPVQHGAYPAGGYAPPQPPPPAPYGAYAPPPPAGYAPHAAPPPMPPAHGGAQYPPPGYGHAGAPGAPPPPMGPAAPGGLEQAAEQAGIKSISSWFYWLAGLSLINAVAAVFGGNFRFIFGLGFVELISGLGASEEFGANTGTRVLALVMSAMISGAMIYLGREGGKGKSWPFLVGLIGYAFDTVLVGIAGEWLMLLVHLFIAFRFFQGWSQCRELEKQFQTS